MSILYAVATIHHAAVREKRRSTSARTRPGAERTPKLTPYGAHARCNPGVVRPLRKYPQLPADVVVSQ